MFLCVSVSTLLVGHTHDIVDQMFSVWSKLLRIKHTSSVNDTLDMVRGVMDLAVAEFHATAEQYRRLAECQINEADLRKYIKRVFQARASNNATDESASGLIASARWPVAVRTELCVSPLRHAAKGFVTFAV